MSTISQFRRLPFTFDVPDDADGILVCVGRADPTTEEVTGTFQAVAGGTGRVALAWHFRVPSDETNGVCISEGTAAQGADDFEVLSPGDGTNWQGTKPSEYYRIVGDGGASRVSGWAITQPA